MRIASWNVNSIKSRLDIVTNWLSSGACDVLLIQETKSQDVNFPVDAFTSIGWNVAIHGQKSYNGVAIASHFPIHDIITGLPGDDTDEQARAILRRALSGHILPVFICRTGIRHPARNLIISSGGWNA